MLPYTIRHTPSTTHHFTWCILQKTAQLQFTITFPAIYFLRHICIDMVVVFQCDTVTLLALFSTLHLHKMRQIFVSRAHTHIFHIFLFDHIKTIIFFYFLRNDRKHTRFGFDSNKSNLLLEKWNLWDFFLYHPVSIRDCLYQVSREIHDLYCVLWVAMFYFTSGFFFVCCCCCFR